MITCIKCRHWQPPKEKRAYGYCKCSKRTTTQSYYIADGIYPNTALPIRTGPEYGCIHGEKRK